jgi:hypothetical protein
MNEKRLMYRVIRTQEGEMLLDPTGRGNGRGAYICPNQECLELAIKSRGLERSFKMKIDGQVYEALREEMRKES